MTTNRKRIALVAVLALALGAGGWWWAQSTAPHQHTLVKATDEAGETYWTCPMHPQVRQAHPGNCPICGMKLVERSDRTTAAKAGAQGGEREILYWYDPMKPEVHFDAPGKSPFMDMDLVPKYAEGGDTTIVEIDPRMAQNLGMRTARVTTGTFWHRIDTVGGVALDERRIVTVESRAAGWVEALHVRAEGDRVKKGEPLATLYSPELYAAAQELNLAEGSGDALLIDAARERLRLLGGRAGTRATSTVHAPTDGFVASLAVREGAQLTPGMALMTIADLAQVWIQVEIPESQAGWVGEGRPVEARLKSLPGRVFEGTVDYLYPTLDRDTRTLRARLVFDNPEGLLRPGMYADVALFGGARREVLLAPSEAVIRTGQRNVVIVAEGEGRYRPAFVELGAERGDEIEILSGVEPGTEVVVSGQFLIDSEASLLGAYQRMGTSPYEGAHGDVHSGHAP